MTSAEVAQRFDNRIGYRLVAYGDVGLPIFRVTSVSLCMARRELGPIEEFVLRAISLGMDLVPDIAGLLGLETSVIDGCLSELLRTEAVRLEVPATIPRRVHLTHKGRELASTHELSRPVEQTIVFCVDGLTRKPKFYPNELLFRGRHLRDRGVPELKPIPLRGPELEELDIKDVSIAHRFDSTPQERELVRLSSIERRERVFVEAIALVYRPEGGGPIQVSFAMDGRISEEHEQAFARGDGLGKNSELKSLSEVSVDPNLSMILGDALHREFLKAAAGEGSADSLRREATSIRARLASRRPTRQSIEDDEVRSRLETIENQLSTSSIRKLVAYEYATLLRKAVQEARQRLWIVAPGSDLKALDADLADLLSSATRRGVEVSVLAQREIRAPDAHISIKSSSLPATFPNALIKDDNMLALSTIDWLRPDEVDHGRLREEWGILILDPSIVAGFISRIAEATIQPGQ